MAALERVGRARKQALDILGRLGPIRPVEFARLMWPQAKGWDRPHIMNWAARSYLTRLKDAGLASETEFGFMLNAAGLDLRDKLFPIPD